MPLPARVGDHRLRTAALEEQAFCMLLLLVASGTSYPDGLSIVHGAFEVT